MLTLINTLIVFFIIIIGYQIILANHIIEGLDNTQTYKQYDTKDPSNALILAQQNAGNIEYIKQRIDAVQGIVKQVQDLSGNVVTLQQQVSGLVNAQQQYATQVTGGTTPVITGTTN
jgi:methyl-accepting chemotaxis protein